MKEQEATIVGAEWAKEKAVGEGIYYRDVGKELLWQHGSHQPPMAVFIILNMDRNRILSILKLIKSLKNV